MVVKKFVLTFTISILTFSAVVGSNGEKVTEITVKNYSDFSVLCEFTIGEGSDKITQNIYLNVLGFINEAGQSVSVPVSGQKYKLKLGIKSNDAQSYDIYETSELLTVNIES